MNWLRDNQNHTLASWLLGISAVVFVGSLVALREVLIRLPADYFSHDRRAENPSGAGRSVLAIAGKVAKNVLGAALLFAGLVMLLTPGQGILAIVLGVSLLDIPGKRRLQRKLVGRPKVLGAINKLRARAGRPPLEPPSRPGIPA